MTARPVVSNTSAIIALSQVQRLELLALHFTEVAIPAAVARELGPDIVLPGWIVERRLSQPLGAHVLAAQLGAGESEALNLAVELQARWVILDDRPARRVAEALRLPVIGTLGVLLAAKRRGWLASVRPVLDALLDCGFYAAPRLRERVLADAGELPT